MSDKHKFLSDAWFAKVAELNASAGELHLPPNLAKLIINVNITGDDAIHLHLKNGFLIKGHDTAATSTINIDSDTLGKIITNNDVDTALEAFMTGKIRIDGDMSQVMALQTAKPSQEQKDLYKQILQATDF